MLQVRSAWPGTHLSRERRARLFVLLNCDVLMVSWFSLLLLFVPIVTSWPWPPWFWNSSLALFWYRWYLPATVWLRWFGFIGLPAMFIGPIIVFVISLAAWRGDGKSRALLVLLLGLENALHVFVLFIEPLFSNAGPNYDPERVFTIATRAALMAAFVVLDIVYLSQLNRSTTYP
ncbi:MAG: hypothetical protein ACT4QE_09745 [Anaerolineales bacterium]